MKRSRYFQNWKVLGMEDRQHVHSPAFVVCLKVQVRTYLLLVVVSVRDYNEVFCCDPFINLTRFTCGRHGTQPKHTVSCRRVGTQYV